MSAVTDAPRLLVCCARLAPAWTLAFAPSRLVTLGSPGSAVSGSEAAPQGRLDLVFNDIAEPRDGLVAPSRQDAERLLAFAGSWNGAQAMLLCCYAGVSRSPAAAYAIACMRLGAGAEAALAQALRAAAPSATPNARMVALADSLLGRGGRMIEAIAAIGRGADAFEGEGLAWDLASGAVQRLAAAPSSTPASQACSTAPSTSPV